MPERRRVAIVGGGFGGVAAAHALRDADVDVTVIDRMNHTVFQPLLYQVAAGILSMGDAASPIRSMLARQKNVRVLMAEVEAIDPERRELTLDRGEVVGYDSLIVACGATTSYFGHDEFQEHASSLKTIADATALRDRIHMAFEEAESTSDDAAREELLTFVIIGGGPTGVEVAGQLGAMTGHRMRNQFDRFDPARARIVLLDASDRVLTPFSPSLSAKAAKALAALGVEVIEGAM